MKTALLAGQEVRFQNKAGKVLNRGASNGMFCSMLCFWSPTRSLL